jgi:heptosyltransferase-2
MFEPDRVLIIAPNWLGDAVMALPAIADVKRRFPAARLTVAARRSVADMFALAPDADDVVTLGWSGRWWQRRAFQGDVTRLRELGADIAVLFPNSFATAWLVSQASVPARWGYATDFRRRLLSRAVRRPSGGRHQGAYYQHLTSALGFESGPMEPRLDIPPRATQAARSLLIERRWDSRSSIVALAPGAAYGTAKRWLPRSVARLITELARHRHTTCVLLGSRTDAATTTQIRSLLDRDVSARTIDLTGETTLEMLAAVLGLASACVSNDSGAMHVAAALGTPTVAIFGPTREYETAPLTRAGGRAEVLTHPVWCRPCMLRECPIDHRCMKGITPERVLESIQRLAPAKA